MAGRDAKGAEKRLKKINLRRTQTHADKIIPKLDQLLKKSSMFISKSYRMILISNPWGTLLLPWSGMVVLRPSEWANLFKSELFHFLYKFAK